MVKAALITSGRSRRGEEVRRALDRGRVGTRASGVLCAGLDASVASPHGAANVSRGRLR